MHPQPEADLLSVDDPEVDVAALAAQLQSAAAEKRRAGLYQDVAREGGDDAPELQFGPRLSLTHEGAEIIPYGPPVSRAKRAVRRALRWYLWPITGQMTAHNRAAADVIAEHDRQLARLRLELERVQRDADRRRATPTS